MEQLNNKIPMTGLTYQFDFNDLKISSSMIESVLGYKEGEDRGLVTDLIEKVLEESHEIGNIKAEYRVYDDVRFDNETKSVTINNIKFQIKKIVFGQIKKSESVAVFLCTAGAEIGQRSREAMSNKDLLKGYIYDVVGSEIVEAAADLMQGDIERNMLTTGKKITNRYSPGYCGWDVTEQHNLFELLPENFCDVKLTLSALMDPVKSVSGIIGIGENVKSNPYTCRLCDMKNCVYRGAKEKT
jgi:Vitamin B12 dependent methionine synthase, activation domain